MLATVQDVSNKSFDYIIIGGGSAGLTIAARLTDNPNVSVLVLEAGSANIDDAVILRPASYGSHFGKPAYEWGHRTVPQKHCNGTQFDWPRGKGLGGSSAINFLCWVRPPAEEINDLERLGNPGWNWKNYTKYSQNLVKYALPSQEEIAKHDYKVDGWVNSPNGALIATLPKTVIPGDVVLQKTLLNLGFKHAKDPLGGDPTGVSFLPSTIDPVTHTRSYSTTAFYLPAKQRKNLTVLCNAYVNRIITETGAGGSVLGRAVEFDHDGNTHTATIGKEVVVSAGALKSPQILELSGIGRRDVLQKLDIPVKLDLPVGENVQEHMYIGVTFELRPDIGYETLDILRDPTHAEKHVKLHAEGQGLFTTALMSFAFAPLTAYSKRAGEIYKAAREKILGNADKYPPGLLEQYKVQLDRLDRGAPGCELVGFHGFLSFPNPPSPEKQYFTVLVPLNHLFSRGTIHCTSSDPKVDPAYDPHYFEEEIDLQTFIECVKFARRLKDTAPFKDTVVCEVNPGPNCVTDEQIGDTASSVSMLPKDKGGVLDPELKVYGSENIRVADLSCIPLHFAAHPQATVYALAEQAADIIKSKA